MLKKAVQTRPTLLRNPSLGNPQLPTTRSNMQRGVQTDATCNIQQCWELLTNSAAPFAWGLR